MQQHVMGGMICMISDTPAARELANDLWRVMRESPTNNGEQAFALLTIIHNMPEMEDPETGKVTNTMEVVQVMDAFVRWTKAQDEKSVAADVARRLEELRK